MQLLSYDVLHVVVLRSVVQPVIIMVLRTCSGFYVLKFELARRKLPKNGHAMSPNITTAVPPRK